MNIFGRYVSLQVLYLSLISLAGIVGGVVQNVVTGWNTKDPEGMITLIAGGVMAVITGALHIWDTMPANATASDKAKVGVAPVPAQPAQPVVPAV
jgi:hypothetical protein